MVTVAQRLDRRLDNELGRAKIRLADAEADDVAALGGQRIGAGEDREGIFLADPVEIRDCLQHFKVLPGAFLFGRHFTAFVGRNQQIRLTRESGGVATHASANSS